MNSKRMARINGDAWQRHDQPVAVILKDGTYYVGWITDADRNQLTLSGKKGLGKVRNTGNRGAKKAKVTGFFPGNPTFGIPASYNGTNPFGFAPYTAAPQPAAGSGVGGFGGFMGFMKQVLPTIQVGWGIVRAVMPLLGGLR